MGFLGEIYIYIYTAWAAIPNYGGVIPNFLGTIFPSYYDLFRGLEQHA